MIDLLKELHYDVHLFRDLTSSQIMDTVSTFSGEQRHEEFDTFACVLMSHGRMGEIFGSDGRLVSIISDITEMFANCLSLKGKPKIFFVQACQMPYHRGEFIIQANFNFCLTNLYFWQEQVDQWEPSTDAYRAIPCKSVVGDTWKIYNYMFTLCAGGGGEMWQLIGHMCGTMHHCTYMYV